MVTRAAACIAEGVLVVIAQSQLSKLPPVERVRLLGGLILLTIGGVSLVVLCWLALRVGRRSLRREDRSATRVDYRARGEDWASQPLSKPEPAEPDE